MSADQAAESSASVPLGPASLLSVIFPAFCLAADPPGWWAAGRRAAMAKKIRSFRVTFRRFART
jgi:hypothetical protein